MKIRLAKDSLKRLLINIAAVLGITTLLSFSFFYQILPSLTNKGHEVYVPDLTGLTFEEAVKILEAKNLSYEVSDSVYSPESDPLTVVDQYPNPSSKVKADRKINIRLNPKIAPTTTYPDLTDSNFDLALERLKSLDLRIGTIEYRQDIADNSILESKVEGKAIQTGEFISKGTKVDLVVGRDSLKIANE